MVLAGSKDHAVSFREEPFGVFEVLFEGGIGGRRGEGGSEEESEREEGGGDGGEAHCRFEGYEGGEGERVRRLVE